MAISEELKQIYSNYDDNRQFYDTVQLYHPNFEVTSSVFDSYPSDTAYPSDYDYPDDVPLLSLNKPYPKVTNYPGMGNYPSYIKYIEQSYFLIMDSVDHELKIEDGSTHRFQAYPFRVIQPQVGEDQQDIGIIFDNVSLEIIKGIELAAENATVPIEMTFRVYMDGSLESQTIAIRLSLTEIVVDMFTVSCKASRVDLYARSFPFGDRTYFLSNFEGLIV